MMNSVHKIMNVLLMISGQKAALQELQHSDRGKSFFSSVFFSECVCNTKLIVFRSLITARKLAFSASLLASGQGNTALIDNARLIYRNVITNIGNHYNPNTGILIRLLIFEKLAFRPQSFYLFVLSVCVLGYFTAPVTGVYYFRFTGHVAHSDASMRLGIFKNGHLILTSGDRHTTSTDPEDNASNGVTLQLEKGDVVSVHLAGIVWDDQYHRSTFSGFLLFVL